ncbi:MAG TPA: ABC transporter, partial [Ramlibacter sp.]|nr:ABC transporter [Ramlibacter sp.]
MPADATAAKGSPKSLTGLLPFLRPYGGRIAAAGFFLLLAAAATLLFPLALRGLVDGGLAASGSGERLLALREHFLLLFAV